jgi:hypothetical protein
MPSLFSRGSKKDKRQKPQPLLPQSATLPSRNSGTGGSLASPRPDSATFRKVNGYRQEVGEFGTTPSKSQYVVRKKKMKLIARTLPNKNHFEASPIDSPCPGTPPALPPKYSFLPLHIPSETPSSNSIDSFAYSSDEVTSLRPYGILAGVGSKIILGIEEVGKVIKDVGAELEKRGKLRVPGSPMS